MDYSKHRGTVLVSRRSHTLGCDRRGLEVQPVGVGVDGGVRLRLYGWSSYRGWVTRIRHC